METVSSEACHFAFIKRKTGIWRYKVRWWNSFSKNGDHYKPLLFEGTLTDHLEMMRKPGVWGTQVELQAAADYYKMSIYLLTKREQQDRCQWNLYRPRNSALPADGFPHIELAHPGSVHFACIVDTSTVQNSKSIPQLDGGTDNLEGIL